jgi:hypothetical protein
VKFWRIYFFGLQGAKRRRSQSYGEHLQRGRAKKERDKNHLPTPRGVYKKGSKQITLFSYNIYGITTYCHQVRVWF